MPSATHPGQPLSVWRLHNSRGQCLGEINPDDPDREFLRQAREVLASADTWESRAAVRP